MKFDRLLSSFGMFLSRHGWAQTLLGLVLLGLLAVLARWLVSQVLRHIAQRLFVLGGREDWDRALHTRHVYRRLQYAAPFVTLALGIGAVPHLGNLAGLLERIAHAGAWICLFLAFGSVLSAWQDVYAATVRAQTRSIKGYIQLGKLVLGIVCSVLVLSILLDRSPLWMLSGLGALSAVLLLVFKDTLLSLVASTQLTSNDMLRIGDWIEMPQCNADGMVNDIALHTVKVQNWDNTVTTVPTYKLFAESYRNYRHMYESGARRIKRQMRLDARSVRFVDEQEAARLHHFRLLREYLNEKLDALAASNRELGADEAPFNQRRLTNIGTFRAYALAYLRAHPELRQDMTMMVRMMEPQSEGIPIEIYCFTSLTALTQYERVQGDIFDHLLAILPALGLRLYQAPSGSDLSSLGAPLREAAGGMHSGGA